MRSVYVSPRPVTNAYLVRERDRRLLRELLTLMAVIFLVAAGLLGNIWGQAQLLAASYRIDDQERSLHRLEERARQLRLEAAFLSSPGQVEERAANELGMQPWVLDQLVFARELE